jgi:hypothetical protein
MQDFSHKKLKTKFFNGSINPPISHNHPLCYFPYNSNSFDNNVTYTYNKEVYEFLRHIRYKYPETGKK